MGIMFCCLSEGDKVGRVLNKFPAEPVSQAKDGHLQKLIGRVVLAGNQPFYAPANNVPCVWFKIIVEEERIVHYQVTVDDGDDGNGGRRSHKENRTRMEWHTICTEERFTDFYLQDGLSKLFVQGSNRGRCKIQGTRDSNYTSVFRMPPPGIQALIMASMPMFEGWNPSNHRTGNFRYTQQSFDVNELVAALGLVAPAVDPFTGLPNKSLAPIQGNILTERYFADNNWTDWDKRSWEDLCTKSPSVLLSDAAEFTGGVMVAPVMVPAWQTPAGFNPAAYASMYAGGGMGQPMPMQMPNAMQQQPMGYQQQPMQPMQPMYR